MNLLRYALVIVLIPLTTTIWCKSDPAEYNTPSNIAQAHDGFSPWFTGPILAPAGHTMPPGHTNWEPYLFVTDNVGVYNHHWKSKSIPKNLSVNPSLVITHGLTKWMDAEIIPQVFYNNRDGAHSSRVGDFYALLGFQAMKDILGTWKPDLRITIGEIFPTGHYQHLNPDDYGADASGLGSYQTKASLTFQKLFRIGIRLLRTRFLLSYTIPSDVTVEGFNTYGGGYDAKGRIRVGNIFNSIFAFEYTLTQNWVAALDIQFTQNNGSSFKGFPGITKEGQLSKVQALPASQLSLAPAIEYNFSPTLGIIAGVWFSACGRNAADFVSGVIAVNYYH